VASVRADVWIDVWTSCHALTRGLGGKTGRTPPTVHRVEWPDGGAYMDQENVVIEVFRIIETEWLKSEYRRLKRG